MPINAANAEHTDTREVNSIDSVVIHKLVKERHGKVTIVNRPALLQLTGPVNKLVHDIYELYASRTSKGYGRFEADEINFPSATILRKTYKNKTQTFLEATHELMTVLASKAGQAPLATGGYVLMAQLSNPKGGCWFIAAILTNVKGSAINDASLEIEDSVHVDLQNLRVAGRVNLTDWLSDDNEVRYIGFLKHRGEVSDYFKLFLGCSELIASSEETKKLVAVLKDFAVNSGLDLEKQETFLKSAYDFCLERKKNDQPLILEALTNAIWPEAPEELQKVLTAGNVQIADGFVPDGRSLNAFVKIKAKTQYWSLEIDRHALVSGQAKFDPDKGTLTLTELPNELLTELKNELGNG